MGEPVVPLVMRGGLKLLVQNSSRTVGNDTVGPGDPGCRPLASMVLPMVLDFSS